MFKLIFKVAITAAAAFVMANHEAWACGYPQSDPLHERQEACNERGDKVWSCQLNLCTTREVVLETQNELARCDSAGTQEARNECRTDTARRITEREKQVSLDKTKLSDDGKIASSLSGALATFYLLADFSKDSVDHCTGLSTKLMTAGGLVGVFGPLLAHHKYKKDLDKINKQYDRLINEFDGTDAQVEAFSYLAAQQNKLNKAASNFEKAHKISGGLFAAAAIAAMFSGGVTPSPEEIECSAKETTFNRSNFEDIKKDIFDIEFDSTTLDTYIAQQDKIDFLKGKLSSTSIDEYQSMRIEFATITSVPYLKESVIKFFNIVDEAFFPRAQASPLVAPLLGTGVGIWAAKAGWGHQISTPTGRVILSGVASGISFMAADAYGKQADDAANREKAIIEMRDTLAARLGYFECPERDDPRKPQCYCMLGNDQINEARSESEACQAYWLGGKPFNLPDAGVYSRGAESTITGCVNSGGNFDRECSCQRNNSCLTAPTTFSAGFNFGALSRGVATMARNAAGLTRGRISAGSLTSDGAGQAAFRAKKALEKVLLANNAKLRRKGKSGFTLTPSDIARGANSLASRLPANMRSAISNFKPNIDGSNSGLSEKAAKAIQEAASQSGIKNPFGNKKQKGSSLDDYMDFGGSSRSPASSNVLAFESEQAKNYDFKGNDINKDNGQSIFEILTYRYHTTALEKLFQE